MSLTEKGFHRPTYNEILASKIQTAKELFGEDIETDEKTPLGKFIRIGAKDLSKTYDDLEATYYARFPNTASGVSLDRLCVFAGITRNPATYAEHIITVSGEPGTEVSEIVVCGENRGVTYHNISKFTIPETGSIDIVVECDTAGMIGNVKIINEIVNPISGVESVEYKDTELYAEDIESDYDLRKRYAVSVEGIGSSNVNGIRAAILKVPTVKSVSIVENNENTTVSGRPPHSFECFVCGGENHKQEIAEAIFSKAPVGVKTCSTTIPTPTPTDYWCPVTVYDDANMPHYIYYSFTKDININISVQYKTDNRFAEDGETQIQNQISEYINIYGVGDDVVLSALYGYIYKVQGVIDVTSIILSAAGKTPTEVGNIVIDNWEVARLGTVTLTEVQ